jgi:hypothetical protein
MIPEQVDTKVSSPEKVFRVLNDLTDIRSGND